MPDESNSPQEVLQPVNDPPKIDAEEFIMAKVIENSPNLFDGIDDSRKKEIVNQVVSVSQKICFSISRTHMGPLPDPSTLDGYNKVVKGGAERVFKEFEKQGDHRRDIEKRVVRCDNTLGVTGQIMAFILALGFGGAGFYLVVNGFSVAGSILLTIDIVGLASVFIIGRHWQKKVNKEE